MWVKFEILENRYRGRIRALNYETMYCKREQVVNNIAQHIEMHPETFMQFLNELHYKSFYASVDEFKDFFLLHTETLMHLHECSSKVDTHNCFFLVDDNQWDTPGLVYCSLKSRALTLIYGKDLKDDYLWVAKQVQNLISKKWQA